MTPHLPNLSSCLGGVQAVWQGVIGRPGYFAGGAQGERPPHMHPAFRLELQRASCSRESCVIPANVALAAELEAVAGGEVQELDCSSWVCHQITCNHITLELIPKILEGFALRDLTLFATLSYEGDEGYNDMRGMSLERLETHLSW